METVGDLSMCLVCQWWFCINIGRVRNKIHTVKYDFACLFSAAPWLMLCVWNSHFTHFAGGVNMNYALSKLKISCLKSYMHLPRFCLYYQDELQMEKCLMEWGSLTSLFRIQIFIFKVDPYENVLNLLWIFLNEKWKIRENAKHITMLLQPWFECKAFSIQ